jgi:hypothetical protein
VARNRARYLLLSVKPLASSNMCTTENVKVNSNGVLKHKTVATTSNPFETFSLPARKSVGKGRKEGQRQMRGGKQTAQLSLFNILYTVMDTEST